MDKRIGGPTGGTRPAAPDVVDRCRKCGQTSTCFATTPPPASCWARLPNGRACNGNVFDRTPKGAKASRRPGAAVAAPARRPVDGLTSQQRETLAWAREHVAKVRAAQARWDAYLRGRLN